MPDVDLHVAGVLAVADDLTALRAALDRLAVHARQGSVPDSGFGSPGLNHQLPALLAAHQDEVVRALVTAAALLGNLTDDLRAGAHHLADQDQRAAEDLMRAGEQ